MADKTTQPTHNGKGVSIKKAGHTHNGQFGSDPNKKTTNNPARDLSAK